MRRSRPTVGVPATTLLLVSLFLASGRTQPDQTAQDETPTRMEGRRLTGTTSQVERTNVEYSGEDRCFLALRGGREAEIEVLPRGGGSEVKIELRGPAAGGAQESGASAGGSKR